MTPAEREEFEERAGILQFTAGLSKADAERIAMQMCEDARRFFNKGVQHGKAEEARQR